MIWVYLASGLFAILIFPIGISAYVFFDGGNKRLNFGIFLYGKLKVLGGYAKYSAAKIVIHLKETKAVVISPSSIKLKGGMGKIRAIEFLQLKTATVFPLEAESAMPATAVAAFEGALFPVLKTEKDFMDVGYSVRTVNNSRFMAFLKTVLVVNLLTVLISFIKSLTEKK